MVRESRPEKFDEKLQGEFVMNRSISLGLAGLVLGSAALVSCNKSPEKVVIGVSAELTGSIPVAGQSCKNAAEFAVATVNAAGGL